jgi:hypothetical protein
MTNFDFGGFIDDDNKFEELPLTEVEENCLSPYGILCAMLGRVQARKAYARLVKIAQRISDVKGGRPAILLDEDGGEFVTIHEEHV